MASNVYAKTIQVRDKKGKAEYGVKYKMIGFADEATLQNPDQEKNAVFGFSLTARQRDLQMQASKLRIASLRKNFGGIIAAKDPKTDAALNPFNGGDLQPGMKASSS